MPMGRFDPKYSRRQREAIIGAVLDGSMGRKLNCPQAVELASRGALGLSPYQVSLTTAREWCRKERRNREAAKLGAAANGAVSNVVEGERRRILAWVHQEIDRLERARTGKGDVDRAIKLAEVLKRLDTPSKKTTGLTGTPKGNAGGKKHSGPKASALAERITAAARASVSASTDPPEQQDGSKGTNGEPNEREEGDSDSSFGGRGGNVPSSSN